MNEPVSAEHRADPRVIQLLCGILGVVLALGLLAATHLKGEFRAGRIGRPRREGLKVGQLAPAFSGTDTEGNAVAWEDYAGKPKVLVFSSPGCSACKMFYEALASFDFPPSEELVVWVVSSADGEANASVAAEYGFEMPMLHVEEEVFEAYKVPGVPYVYLVDGEGKVAYSGFGMGKDGGKGTLQQVMKKAWGG